MTCKRLSSYISGLRPSIISGPFPFPETNGTKNGVSKPNIRHSFSYVNGHNTFLLHDVNGHSEKDSKVENLEKEIEKLRSELDESRAEVKRLQEREHELTDRSVWFYVYRFSLVLHKTS